MSTITREATRRHAGPVDDRLTRLLDAPFFVQVVPYLAPETLHQLIRYRGLDACGELVTSATPAQLTSLLDLDLWRAPQPGRNEQFDVDRFGEWLEVLVETGESVAARTVAALGEDLVIAGLSRYVRVFDPGTFEPTEASDDEPMDRHEMMNSERIGDGTECEMGGYLVRARRTDAWDAILALLAALESGHEHYFHAVMRGCRRLSNSRPEVDGLDELLMAPEQHVHDVAIERERRRSRQGYATPADARAFLRMARQPHTAQGPAASALAPGAAPAASGSPAVPAVHNPIAAAYFREGDEDADVTSEETAGDAPQRETSLRGGDTSEKREHISASIGTLTDLLAEAGLIPERPRALLAAADDDRPFTRLPVLRRLVEFLLQDDRAEYYTRSRELAFLANALLAGASVQSRSLTPQEASDAAASICNLGLDCWTRGWPGPAASSPTTAPVRESDTAALTDDFLVDHDLVTAFEVGWSVLYRDVSLFVADELLSTLARVRCADADTRRGLRLLRDKLSKARAAGTPWLARAATEALAALDPTAWVSVAGLLDECPVLPDAVTAILEHRTTSVSPTAFRFLSTADQIGDVRVFMRALPGLLTG